MKYDLCVFDMAGTTVDDSGNSVAAALCDAFLAAGYRVAPETIDPVMGIPKPLAIRTILADIHGKAPSDEQVSAIHRDFQERMVEYYRTSPKVKEIAGASDLFRELKGRGVRVTLDTGFDRRILNTIVDRLGWKELIDDSCASDEVTRGRPDPELIHVLMKRAGVTDARRVAKFGDSISDLEQGKSAGCGFIGAILCERTEPHLHKFPGVVGLRSIAGALAAMEAAG